VPPIFQQFPVLSEWNTRPLPSPRLCTTLRAPIAASFNGTGMGSSSADVQHPTFPVYHVPCQLVLTLLPNTGIDREIEFREVPGPLRFDDFREFLFFFRGKESNAIVVLTSICDRRCTIRRDLPIQPKIRIDEERIGAGAAAATSATSNSWQDAGEEFEFRLRSAWMRNRAWRARGRGARAAIIETLTTTRTSKAVPKSRGRGLREKIRERISPQNRKSRTSP
jgi:hypothetical protein